MVEKDISNLAKPEIKGRGFLQSGNQIIEVQTYYTQPENDWVFDEEMKVTYDNPVYLEQKKRRNETVDDSGFVVPRRLSEIEEEKNKKEDLKVEDFVDTDDEDDEIDDFFDDDSDPIKVAASKKESLKKPESEKPKIPERPERPNRPERLEKSNKEPIKQESIKQENTEKVTPIIEKPKKVEQVIRETGSKQQIINESKQENKNIFNNDEFKTKPKQVFRESNAKPKFNFKKKD